MSDREKLIELINEGIDRREPTLMLGERIADHLIAHGVTLVTDNNVGCKSDYCSKCHNAVRTDELFVVINPNNRKIETQFNFCPACGRKLPQPPKGE